MRANSPASSNCLIHERMSWGMKGPSTIDDELSHPYHRAAALSTDRIGVTECWSTGVLGYTKTHHSNAPLLQYSILVRSLTPPPVSLSFRSMFARSVTSLFGMGDLAPAKKRALGIVYA